MQERKYFVYFNYIPQIMHQNFAVVYTAINQFK